METSEHARAAFPTDDHGPPHSGSDPRFRPDSRRDMPCGCHKVGSRNLIVCIDGTANQFGDKNTNVIELYNLILKEGHNQRTWYNSGIGTYVQPSPFSYEFYKQWLFYTIDLAIAWDFKKTVLGAYRWLSENYEPGDCIFLFGFSRGAYQVRVLSAMIEKVGLIYKGNELQIPFAYQLYADPTSGDDNINVAKVGQPNQFTSKASRFKSAFSMKDVKVHFVGAWDTVSSIGVVRGTNMLPLTIDGMKHVCYFRHALALDERRVKFLPEYAYGGSSIPAAASTATPEGKNNKGMSASEVQESRKLDNAPSNKDKDTAPRPTASLPHTKEVWFAGTHSDIGGGNIQNEGMDRSRPPLRWMVFEAGAAGLRTALFDHELSPTEQITIIESLTGVWRLFELFPIKRLTYTRKGNGQMKTTRMPHRGTARKMHPGQKIHSSLLRADEKIFEKYTPKARPVNDDRFFWETLRDRGIGGEAHKWLEVDLDDYIKNIVEQLITEGSDAALQSLHHMAISSDARQSLYDAVVEALNQGNLTIENKQRLLHSTTDVLKRSCRDGPDFKLSAGSKIRPFLLDLWNADLDDHRRTAREFVALFTDPCQVLHIPDASFLWTDGHGKRAASILSGDSSIQIWDMETRNLKPVGEPLRGHTDSVNAVAFSSDGKHVVSGSDDYTVRIWDIEIGKPVGEPLRGHTRWVSSVAFSSDGKRVVSGSADKTVRVWDVETGMPMGEPLRGHTDWVWSAMFSSDGKRVVSGSDDMTVRIWDVKTGKPVGEPLQGHTNFVRSVSFSSDGKHVVSGSRDHTVRIWDAETGRLVGEPLRGHRNWVNSVAFSSDNKRVASGSSDKTVRIWDVATGEPVGEPLRGYTSWVWSVAFSSDGKRIVSTSLDGMVRIWDLDHPKFQ